MKKLFILGFVLAVSTSFVPLAHAVQYCPSGGDGECTDVGGVTYECDTSQQPYTCVAADTGAGAGNLQTGATCTSDGQCSGNLACIYGTCQIDPSLEDTGTAAAGGSCNPQNNNNDCPGGQTCSATSATTGTCTGATGNAAASNGNATGFVPLAPIPGLTSQTNNVTSDTIAAFLNNLYKYLIGIAAVIAVIEIIWGGILIMGQESVSKKGEERHKIQQAILGLVLVLSPVLVFTIINPAILNLSLSLPPIQMQSVNQTTSTGQQTECTQSDGVTPGVLNTSTNQCTNQTPQPGSSCGSGTGIWEPGKGCITTTNNGANVTTNGGIPDCSATGPNCPSVGGTYDGRGGCTCNGPVQLQFAPSSGPNCSATGGICPAGDTNGAPNGKGGCTC